jgi:uncharacterized repeat protein (TIGR03803 family)
VIALVCAVTLALSSAVLSATVRAPEAVATAARTVASETVVYSFCSEFDGERGICLDGDFPFAGLIEGSDGNLFGTTLSSGANSEGGTVFEMTPSGALVTLHSFCSQIDPANYRYCLDGAGPKFAGLIQASDGNFYGTTSGYAPFYFGGANGQGTVFKLTPSGTLTTLYAFCNQTGTDSFGATSCLDGATPEAGLIQGEDGNFYGTTTSGGANGAGTVFKITPSAALTTLYSFCNQEGTNSFFGGLVCLDGGKPLAALIQGSDGNLYGTTAGGGTNDEGTVFKITPSGTLTTLYSFCSQIGTDSSGDILCPDGALPNAGLIKASDGNFYGTTSDDRISFVTRLNSAGTVFKITPAGELTTLYSFCSVTDVDGQCVDGEYPQAGLIQASDGNFYGTTTGGGASDVLGEDTAGTVFQITPAGTLTTLYSFCSVQYPPGDGYCLDGNEPEGGLIQASDGNFYGTTWFGSVNGYGSVFKLSVSVVTPTDATLTVSPREASFGNPFVTTYRTKTFEVRAEASKKNRVNPVFLEDFFIKPRNNQNYAINPVATTCVRGKPLAAGSTCRIVVGYWPLAATPKGQFDTATLEVTTNAEKTMPAANSGVIEVMLKGKSKLF